MSNQFKIFRQFPRISRPKTTQNPPVSRIENPLARTSFRIRTRDISKKTKTEITFRLRSIAPQQITRRTPTHSYHTQTHTHETEPSTAEIHTYIMTTNTQRENCAQTAPRKTRSVYVPDHVTVRIFHVENVSGELAALRAGRFVSTRFKRQSRVCVSLTHAGELMLRTLVGSGVVLRLHVIVGPGERPRVGPGPDLGLEAGVGRHFG